MASYSDSPPSSPGPRKRRPKSWAVKCERCCCSVVNFFPLVFVHGVSTWAVWVEAGVGFLPGSSPWRGPISSIIGVLLYVVLNWSYTIAVWTDAGSPLTTSGSAGYSSLPSHEPISQPDLSSFTVKSTGGARYCKKCEARKPDRAHHCSTCKRCVLKMDHHCPWLATCVGLKNYKPFLLFLIYTSIFCWLCFGITAAWLWAEVLSDGQYTESLMPINYVLLALISGIIGLVLTGFTAWHISLAWRGQTTIECLEKTRYLSPLKKRLQKQRSGNGNGISGHSYGQQLAEIHANALPGVTREEEGEERYYPKDDPEQGSEAHESLRRNYGEMERERERDRYEDYLDEQDSDKLPNAFDLGWKRNLQHLFGDRPSLWFLPICNTSGDGWHWEPSQKWVEANGEVRRQREAQWQEQNPYGQLRGGYNGYYNNAEPFDRRPRRDEFEQGSLNTTDGIPLQPQTGRKPNSGNSRSTTSVDSRMPAKTYRRRGSFSDGTENDDGYESSNDGDLRPKSRGEPHYSAREAAKERPHDPDDGWQKRD